MFTQDEILEYALLSKESYSFEAQRDDTSQHYIDVKDVQLLVVAINSKKLVLFAFRGTDSLKDWIHDVNIFHRRLVVPYDGMERSDVRVHSGFLEYWMIIRPSIHELIESMSPDYKFVFMGHSLGGALAQLASLDVQYQYSLEGKAPKVCCVTYGAPRVGNRAFSESRNRRVPKTLNIVNSNDPVFHQPWPVFGYVRSGEVKQIGNKRLFWVPSAFRINDHRIDNYILNL